MRGKFAGVEVAGIGLGGELEDFLGGGRQGAELLVGEFGVVDLVGWIGGAEGRGGAVPGNDVAGGVPAFEGVPGAPVNGVVNGD